MTLFYTKTKMNRMTKIAFLIISILFASSSLLNAQVRKGFSPRMTVERIRGDFTLIGNKNLTAHNSSSGDNGRIRMDYVNVAGGNGILNSSTANLVFSNENGATLPSTTIKFAGLYWTGRAQESIYSSENPEEFSVDGITLNKRKVKFKVPGTSTYYDITANASDIYYPINQDRNMYSAFADVTDIVRNLSNPSGTYTVANIALRESNYTDGTGYYGGWALLVVYENPAMNFRDVVVFDGHAYVLGSDETNYEIPISGFQTTENGPVNMKLGLIAGEGDKNISGDYFRIRNHTNTSWTNLSHGGNSYNNFFNSSIFTGGNTRNPNHTNNYGLDISMFTINNPGNNVIGNNQTSTKFKYGSDQDTYIIFCIAMAVDAYIPEIFLTKTATPTTYSSVGQPITYTFKVENTGNLDLSNVIVNDPTIGQNFGPISTLNAGASQTFTYTYNITQADLDAGEKLNTATATGYIGGTPYSSTDDVTITADQNPDISLTKVATEQTFCTEGDIINYKLTLSNNGNLTIYNPSVTDPGATTGPTYISGDTNNNGVLNVGEFWVYNATYTIQETDVINATYTNTGNAKGSADTDGDGSGDKNVTASASETVTLGNNCCTLSDAEANITEPIDCNGETATVVLSNTGGTSPVTYIFNGVASNDSIFSDVTAGTYNWAVVESGTACDSLKGSITVTEPDEIYGTDQLTACDSLTWIDGITYYEDNNTATYTIEDGAQSGCDSIVTLDLKVNYTAYGTDQLTACDSLTWIDGITYYEDNNTATYTIEDGAQSGCDSIVTLDLKVNYTAYGTDQLTACDSLTWIDGITYYEDNNTATYTIEDGVPYAV